MHEAPASPFRPSDTEPKLRIAALALLVFALTLALRMLEWPSWQNPEYRIGQEWLLATHDAYHWVAGAEGFEFGTGHPMSEILRLFSELSDIPPAVAAFWLPAVFVAFTSVIIFFWAVALGCPEAGLCAAVLCSLAPGHLARTMLGYYDTDLITLCFPLLITLVPARWVTLFTLSPGIARQEASHVKDIPHLFPGPEYREGEDPLAPLQLLALALSGLFAHYALEWHSIFPYLIRYNSLLLALFALAASPSGRRTYMMLGALVYILPALVGLWGAALGALLLLRPAWPGLSTPLTALLSRPATLVLLALPALPQLFDADIVDLLLGHIAGYVKQAGEAQIAPGGTQTIFPAVAQSVIEVRDLTLEETLFYFHPWAAVSALGLFGFAAVLLRNPAALFLLPLGVLGLLGMKMGGRMVMFGAPVVALGVSLPVLRLVKSLLRPEIRGFTPGFIVSLFLIAALAAPVIELIPAMAGGPVLNRRHAEGLERIRAGTPKDAVLWMWWDWGYAAHHFARRRVIVDGAVHGGPSLYLPAAVFASDNPRFSRQLIKYTALKNNEASEVFGGLGGEDAAALMLKLGSPDTPLMEAPGKQYIVVHFEMLRLGFWISYFGSWDFAARAGLGSGISIIPQPLTYRLEEGEVLVQGTENSIFASSINVFEDGRFSRRNYIQEWIEKHPGANEETRRKYYEKRRNLHFFLNRVTDEKLVVDERLHNSLMIQLLISPPGNTALSPYFRLVYDNVFCRVYEVL